MEKESGLPLEELKVDGGISANRFVVQSLADLLGTPIANIGMADVSALGAAMVAGLGSRIFKSIEALEALHQQKYIYQPSTNKAAISDAYEGWKKEVADL
jgi:glycerol kinase